MRRKTFWQIQSGSKEPDTFSEPELRILLRELALVATAVIPAVLVAVFTVVLISTPR